MPVARTADDEQEGFDHDGLGRAAATDLGNKIWMLIE